jgi:hypothetical protein
MGKNTEDIYRLMGNIYKKAYKSALKQGSVAGVPSSYSIAKLTGMKQFLIHFYIDIEELEEEVKKNL